ncbi:Flp family type IVb pilin [Methylobacterium persicinum]|uniref:Pilus assembly protein Flp/PilA n=1 Tax=Methylobacterium persicinum TaxID=374426 RepID=A0ABU0HQT8_9HYPH|nr:pilus assembly protein Flp/PilA [Methylobacterium persicinum]
MQPPIVAQHFVGHLATSNQDFPMKSIMKRFAGDESGATAIEYGMIAALIAVVIIGTLKVIGTQLNAKFSSISAQLN